MGIRSYCWEVISRKLNDPLKVQRKSGYSRTQATS